MIYFQITWVRSYPYKHVIWGNATSCLFLPPGSGQKNRAIFSKIVKNSFVLSSSYFINQMQYIQCAQNGGADSCGLLCSV